MAKDLISSVLLGLRLAPDQYGSQDCLGQADIDIIIKALRASKQIRTPHTKEMCVSCKQPMMHWQACTKPVCKLRDMLEYA